MKRYKELVGRHDKYIELNPTTMSSDYVDLYSNYITSTSDTNYILLTIQWISRREKDTRLAIKENISAERIVSTN